MSKTSLVFHDVTGEEAKQILDFASKLQGKKSSKSAPAEEEEDPEEEEDEVPKKSVKKPAPAKKPVKKKPDPDEEEEDPEEEESDEEEDDDKPSVSLEKIKKKISDLADDHDEEIEALFKKYKLKKVSTLPEGKYDEFWKALLKIK